MTKLGRKRSSGYRDGYLRSRAWYARRREFLATQTREDGTLRCQCLGEVLTADTADVHHVSYEGVTQEEDGTWQSHEADEDLIVLCRWCHERMHTLMDHDRGWSQASRRAASRRIIRTIQRSVLIAAVRQSEDGTR